MAQRRKHEMRFVCTLLAVSDVVSASKEVSSAYFSVHADTAQPVFAGA
jgi:hypothetical protein